jgi:hypothetical protein
VPGRGSVVGASAARRLIMTSGVRTSAAPVGAEAALFERSSPASYGLHASARLAPAVSV